MGVPGDVGRFTVLKKQPKSNEAELLLRRLHSLVKPIMKAHSWFLPCLGEFYPAQSNLLGVNINAGSKICIRLRPAGDPDTFYDMDSLVGTMLHELTHNIRGPHDDTFFRELGKLEDEYDALRAKGYEGEGFYGRGTRVGIGTSHDIVDVDKMRRQRVTELEKRIKIAKIMGGGGRLGGRTDGTRGKTRSEIFAEAAEKRRRARATCGSGGNAPSAHDGEVTQDVLREVQIADEGSRVVASSSPPPSVASSSSRHNQNVAPSSTMMLCGESDDDDLIIVSETKRNESVLGPERPSNPQKKKKKALVVPPPQPSVKTWRCFACTFDNADLLALSCAVCLTARSSFEDCGVWQCHQCTTLTENEFWTCRRCGIVKRHS